jgi:TPM domain
LTGKRAALAALLLAGVAAAGWYAFNALRGFQPRKVVFVNETQDHKHDRALRSSARYFQERTGINLGIVFQEKLPPLTTIEMRADQLFGKLKLGRKSDGKALLFLWSEKERLFKIEVSYDLEPVFPDALCKRLEEGARTFMLSSSPYARRDFIVELEVTMSLHYLDYKKSGRLGELALPDAGYRYVGGYLAGGAGIVGRGYAATVERVQQELKPLPSQLELEMQPGGTPEETVQRYLRSLELGVGEPNVPLLTEASRYFRMDKPHAPGYMRRIRAYYANAMPYRIIERGELAVASFQPNQPVLPIFLRRDEAGLWRVDEPKVWAEVGLFWDGSSRLKYDDAAYAFGIAPRPGESAPRSIFGKKAVPPPLLPMPTNLKERVARAEARVQKDPSSVEAWIELADLLHFEMYWLQSSESVYERIVRLDPERLEMHWRLIDIYQMTSDVEGENREWCEILRRRPTDDTALWYYKWFRKSYYLEDPKTDVCRDSRGEPFG